MIKVYWQIDISPNSVHTNISLYCGGKVDILTTHFTNVAVIFSASYANKAPTIQCL